MLLAAFAAFAQEELTILDRLSIHRRSRAGGIGAISGGMSRLSIRRLANDDYAKQTGNRVMDSMELERTEITGNQELPKVLYIVPWQKADPGDLMGRPVNTLLDEVLAPIDREEFVRQVDYYDDLYGEDKSRSALARV